jgi:hypothetical protein
MLLSQLGVVSVLAGGALAYRSYSKNRTTAGFLLIAGFACLGVAVYLTGGSPWR